MVDSPVAVVGEALVDALQRADGTVRRVPGGSAANTAVALARLGIPTQLSTCLGADADARLLLDHLDDSGVEVVHTTVRRTATAEARVDDDGLPSYDLDVLWRPAPALPHAPRHLHVGSLGAVLRPGSRVVRRLAERASAAGIAVSYDVNLRPAFTGLGSRVVRAVTMLVQLADIVRLSEEDLVHMWPGDPLEESAQTLLNAGAVAVVITRGAEGASWFGRPGRVDVRPVRMDVPAVRVDVPAVPVAAVVDTIGAGDTFTAGMLAGLEQAGALGGGRGALAALDPEAWRDVLELAARCAAVTVGREGADPPYPHELA